MNLANKLFKNNKTGEIVKVIDSFENIAVLENKGKEDVRKLMDTTLYTEQIDPSSFFNNQSAYNLLADKIKSIPTDHMRDEGESTQVSVKVSGDGFRPTMDESAIVMTSEDDEKAELARKYGATLDSNTQVQRQNQAFAKLLGEEESEDLPKVNSVVNERSVPSREYQNSPVSKSQIDDPITTMFRNVKRGVEFKMSIEIQNKIPRIDFIEMMEDSYEISIIDFLAEEFTNSILNNPQKLKDSIKERIKQVVYGLEVTKKVEKIEINPEKVIKTEPEIRTEGVEKTTKVRAKRAKKDATK